MGRRRTALGSLTGGPLSCGIPIALLPEDGTGGSPLTGAPAAPAEPAAEPAGSAEPPGSKTYTQAELNALIGREKSQSQRSALARFAAELGYEKPDELAAIVKRHREEEDARLSEAEKARAEAERERQAAVKDRADAKRELFETRAAKLLTKADAADVEVATAALLGSAFGLTPDSDEKELQAAVEKLKQRTPGLFGAPNPGSPVGDPGTPAPGARPGGAGEKPVPGAQAKAMLERVQSRRPAAGAPQGLTFLGGGHPG